MEEKTCTRCKKILPINAFSKRASSKDRHMCWCKKCCSEYHKEYCTKYPSRVKAQREKWNSSERAREAYKRYDSTHRKQRREKEHKWRAMNKEKLCKKELYKLHNDPVYFFRARCRRVVRESFTRKNLTKPNHTEEIVGCSLIELKAYLLNTWKQKYGREWSGEPFHIDHKRPLAVAKTIEEILPLCHYTNLQMLKPKDNLKKGSKMENDMKALNDLVEEYTNQEAQLMKVEQELASKNEQFAEFITYQKRLKEMKDVLSEEIKEFMRKHNMREHETESVILKLTPLGKFKTDDIEAVPDELCKIVKSLDNKKVKAYVELTGKLPEGVESMGERLTIKVKEA